jgi:hypothetical protein
MNAQALIQAFRTKVADKREPHFWTNPEILAWLNEAQREAAIRGRLLFTRVNLDVEKGDTRIFAPHDLYEIAYAEFKGKEHAHRVPLLSPETAKRHAGHFISLVQGDTWLAFASPLPCNGRLFLYGYRLPKPIEADDAPEINPAHHEKLLDWVFHRAYRVNDADAFDPTAADRHQAEFDRYFGLPVDAGLRRETREDDPHHNEAFWA